VSDISILDPILRNLQEVFARIIHDGSLRNGRVARGKREERDSRDV
jgi:hypothetical protein